MDLSERFCKVDHMRLFLVNVEPEIRIRHGDTYNCVSCQKHYSESDTLTHQQKEAIERDRERQQALDFGSTPGKLLGRDD